MTSPTRKELIEAATHLHDESGCGCDPKYLMSCPNMASAVLQAGRVIRRLQEQLAEQEAAELTLRMGPDWADGMFG